MHIRGTSPTATGGQKQMTTTTPYLETLFFKPNGRVPNSRLPVLIYRNGVAAEVGADLADVLEATFRRNDWLNNWREGVYSYYHYHSTTHEVLGMARGEVTLRLGGSGGQDVEFSAG